MSYAPSYRLPVAWATLAAREDTLARSITSFHRFDTEPSMAAMRASKIVAVQPARIEKQPPPSAVNRWRAVPPDCSTQLKAPTRQLAWTPNRTRRVSTPRPQRDSRFRTRMRLVNKAWRQRCEIILPQLFLECKLGEITLGLLTEASASLSRHRTPDAWNGHAWPVRAQVGTAPFFRTPGSAWL